MLDFSSSTNSAARVYHVDLNCIDLVELAGRLHQANSQPNPYFLINCQQLSCLRTRGVSYLVSQLLLTRQAGADVLLYNVDAVLDRALRLLRLHQVFRILPAPATD